MAGTVSTATSSLASELLLNKIMNGTAQTSTGVGITPAGRAVSERLSSKAYELRTAMKNMDYGSGFVGAIQDEITSFKDQLGKMKDGLQDLYTNNASTSTDYKITAEQMTEIYNQIFAEASGAKYNDQMLFSSAATKLNAGNEFQMSIGGDKIKSKGCFTGVKSAVSAATMTTRTKVSDALTAVNKALSYLQGLEGKYSADIVSLSSRRTLLSDEGASLDSTAAAQGVMGLNSAGNLLSTMLGNNIA